MIDNNTRRHADSFRTLMMLFVVVAMLGWTIACQKVEPSKSTANSSPANTAVPTNSTTPSPASASPTVANADTPAEVGSISLATPTEAYRTGYAARTNKDIATLKRVLAKDALAFLTEIAEVDKKTLDDQLKELAEKPQAPTAETRNEKINGSRASLEYLDEKGKWASMEFSREGNEWKIDLPKAP